MKARKSVRAKTGWSDNIKELRGAQWNAWRRVKRVAWTSVECMAEGQTGCRKLKETFIQECRDNGLTSNHGQVDLK